MQVFSTYYDNVKNLDAKNYTLVRVSFGEPPEWLKKEYEHINLASFFAPTAEILEDCHPLKNWQSFVPRYTKEILGMHSEQEVKACLEKIWADNGKKPLLLLCFEAPPDHCHRQLIGGYFGFNVQEMY